MRRPNSAGAATPPASVPQAYKNAAETNFGIGEAEGALMAEDPTERSRERYFETVEQPRYAERNSDEPMPRRPGQTVHAGRNAGSDDLVIGYSLFAGHIATCASMFWPVLKAEFLQVPGKSGSRIQ